jgi:probable rRNA maturation factor
MPTSATSSARTAKPANSSAAVAVQFACARRGLPSAARFRAWARSAAGGPATLVIRLVSATEARALNSAYRGADHAPNVLSFGYGVSPLAGDVVLCPRVVAREAREQGKSLDAHFAHLTVHGVLHLRGYRHARARDAARMERAEIRILRAFGIANPYRTSGRG